MGPVNSIRLACLIAVAFVSACDSSSKRPATSTPAYVTVLTAPLAECPERVWPGAEATLAEAQILVTGLDERSAYLWQATGGSARVVPVNSGPLGPEWFAPFNFDDFQGRPTLGFNAAEWSSGSSISEENSWRDSSLPIVFHEAFHKFLQENFTTGINSSRSQEYPIRWEPRYARAELIQALWNSLQNGQPLAAAAYWWEQYLATSLQEAMTIASTDRSEGSAQYGGTVMTALADLGCGAAEAGLIRHIVDGLPEPLHFSEADSESYVLGDYAGLLLRQAATTGWELRVEAGETPVEVLLENVEASPQEVNNSLRDRVQADVASANERTALQLDKSIAAVTDAQNYRLVLGALNTLGSFSSYGFYTLTEYPALGEVTLAMSALFSYGTQVRVTSSNAYDFAGQAPCNSLAPQVFSLSRDTLVDNGDGTFTYAGNDITFTRLRATLVEQDGYQWVCPENP